MADDLQGGKQPDGSPTSGATGSQIPASGGSKDATPASSQGQGDAQKREEFIPRERFDQVLESARTLEAKVAELEQKTNQTQSGQRSWNQVSEQDLQYIMTHPTEYPEHASAAYSELRRRDREMLKTEILGEVGVNEFRSGNSEAFDSTTPLGKEVTRIMAQGRSQKEILSDVVELAKYRIGGGGQAADARRQLVQNMQAAGVSAPGADNVNQTPPPSFMTMPKTDFAKYVESIKLGEFNKK